MVFSRKQINFISIALLCVLVIVLFTPLIFYIIPQTLDFPWHISAAASIKETGQYLSSHPTYQWLVIAVHTLFYEVDYTTAGHTATVACYIILAIILYMLLQSALRELPHFKAAVLSLILTLALLVITPVTLLRPDHHFYYGFVFISVYHNPTYLVLKPLAILLFWYILRLWNNNPAPLALIVLTILATLAKPSYTLCLLPALTLYALYCQWRKQPVPWKRLIVCVLLPASLILVGQYVFTFRGVRQTQITLIPFHFFAGYPSPLWIIPKFIMSILFPLVVYLSDQKARQNTSLNLAWLIFGAGVIQAYFLVESRGERVLGSGNWLWGAGISLFVLFVFSTLHFLQRYPLGSLHPRRYPRRFWIGAAAFLMHVISGMVWYSLYAAGGQIAWGFYW